MGRETAPQLGHVREKGGVWRDVDCKQLRKSGRPAGAGALKRPGLPLADPLAASTLQKDGQEDARTMNAKSHSVNKRFAMRTVASPVAPILAPTLQAPQNAKSGLPKSWRVLPWRQAPFRRTPWNNF